MLVILLLKRQFVKEIGRFDVIIEGFVEVKTSSWN